MKKHIGIVLSILISLCSPLSIQSASEYEMEEEKEKEEKKESSEIMATAAAQEPVPTAPSLEKIPEAVATHGFTDIRAAVQQKKQDRERREQEQEYEIKEEARATDLNTHALLVFLDDNEITRADQNSAFTRRAIAALYQEAGPILIPKALLAHLFNIDGNHTNNTKELLKVFYKHFDATKWHVYKYNASGLFFLLIPQHAFTQETKAAFNIFDQEKIITSNQYALYRYFNENDKKEYNSSKQTANNPHLTSTFLTMLPDILSPKDSNGETINWVLYLGGHGGYDNSIAGLSIEGVNSPFQQLLNFLNTKIKTKFLVIDSCNAAGFNAKKIYGELTQSTGVRTYLFAIATGAITDAPSSSRIITINPPGNLSLEITFNSFIEKSKKQLIDYPQALGCLFSLITKEARWPEEIAGIPQIRPPNVPAWFPVTDVNKAVIRIGHVMATIQETSLQKTSLEVKQYRGLDKQLHDPKALLLAVDTIRFPIDIDKNISKIPTFISLLPGPATHSLMSVTYEGAPFDIIDFSGNVAYGNTKIIKIKTLTILNHKKETTIFSDVEITMKKDTIQAFGLDQQGRACIFYKAMQYPLSDDIQQNLFIGALTGNINIMKTAVQKGADIQAKNNNETALLVACKNSHTECVDFLIQEGADITTTAVAGLTPLHWAAIKGDIDVATLLLEKGAAAIINTQNISDATPLMSVMLNLNEKNKKEMVKLLLTYGADPDIKNNDGESPRTIDPEMIRIIEQKMP